MTSEGSRWLWDRLQRPLDEVQVVRAVVGVDESAARHLLARSLLGSTEARSLLEATPGLIRVLRNQQGSVVRVEPSIRGPVLWPATISHRAATGFTDEVFVCASAVRDYDVAENRALASALVELRRAGRFLDAVDADPCRTHLALRAAARRAGHLAGHARLRQVATKRPSARDLTKVRTGTARASYQPALDLWDRITTGPPLEDLAPFIDRRNVAHHELVRLVVTELEARGRQIGPFRTWRGQLFSGHLRYLPPGERGAGAASGVVLDGLALVVEGREAPATAAAVRAQYPHHDVVVATDADVVRRALADDHHRSPLPPATPRRVAPQTSRAGARVAPAGSVAAGASGSPSIFG